MKYKFKDIIEEITEYNSDLKYGLGDIIGVTIEKGLIPTIANLSQTNLEKFYIVKKDTFIYNPRTHGVRLGMGFNDSEKVYITSWNNIAFRVKDQNVVLPKYLWMFFIRPEWDRQANYLAWGSSTIVFAWNDFLNVSIEIPPIEEQRRIVNEYQTVERRIKNNEALIQKLEETAQAIYHHTFVEGIDENNLPDGWRIGCLGDVVTFKVGGDKPDVFSEIPTKECCYPIYSNGVEYKGLYGYTNKAAVQEQSVTISARGNVGTCFLRRTPYSGIVRLVSVIPNEPEMLYYLFYNLSSRNLQGDGSAQAQITVPQLQNELLVIPNKKEIKVFYEQAIVIYDNIICIEKELQHLRTLQSLLTSKLA